MIWVVGQRAPLVGEHTAVHGPLTDPVDFDTWHDGHASPELQLPILLLLPERELDGVIVILPVDGLLDPSIIPGVVFLKVEQMGCYQAPRSEKVPVWDAPDTVLCEFHR